MDFAIVYLRNHIPFIYNLESNEDDTEVDENLVIFRNIGYSYNLNSFKGISEQSASLIPSRPRNRLIWKKPSYENVRKYKQEQ